MRDALNGLSWFSWESQYQVSDEYKLDFYCPTGNVAIEVDGEHHNTESQHLDDCQRESVVLIERSIKIFRIEDHEIDDLDFLRDFIFMADMAVDVRSRQRRSKTFRRCLQPKTRQEYLPLRTI